MVDESRRRLRILHLLLSITETSGAYNQHCLAISETRDITICSLFKSNLAVPKGITLFEGDNTAVGYFGVLKSALAAKEYDIIHAHSPHVGFLLAVANTFMPGKFLSHSVYNVQNSYQNYKLRNKLLMVPVFAFFQRVVCCSQACLHSYPAFYKWLAGDRLCIVPNGLDIDRVDRVAGNKSRRSQNDDFTVATVGRLIEIKNPLTVLNAFQQGAGQKSRLVFIGEGDLRDRLMTEIQARGLDRLELTGLIPRDRVFEKLSQADVVISASRGEGLPVAVMEAMASRCPVILSDIEPHREIATGADFIPLIQPDDVEGFARELTRFRMMSPLERAETGDKCRKLAEERFSLAAMQRKYEQIYAQVLDNRSGASRRDALFDGT
jgi:glycosyltransferase involved in cell wall biosynthesis